MKDAENVGHRDAVCAKRRSFHRLRYCEKLFELFIKFNSFVKITLLKMCPFAAIVTLFGKFHFDLIKIKICVVYYLKICEFWFFP